MKLTDLIDSVNKEYGFNDLTEIVDSGAVEFCYWKLVNDFKNRTCENCKFLDDRNDGIYGCFTLQIPVTKDFGCNKFKRKES